MVRLTENNLTCHYILAYWRNIKIHGTILQKNDQILEPICTCLHVNQLPNSMEQIMSPEAKNDC